MKILEWLLGSSEIEMPKVIAPNVGRTAHVAYDLGAVNVAWVPTSGYTDHLMQTAPLGYSTPEIIIVNGVPMEKPVSGSSAVRPNNAPVRKGDCTK